jgi:hypothetical protein
MKKIFIIIIYLLYTPAFANAQNMDNPFNVALKTLQNKGYLAAIDSLKKLESSYLNSPFKDLQYQCLATYYDFVGNRKQAAICWDKFQVPANYTPAIADSNFLPKNLQAISAKNYLEQQAEKYQVLMINEAHTYSPHRLLTTSLLKELYLKGFQYFAVETLSYKDTLLNMRKYPEFLNTGFYSNEPTSGNMLREALAIGYELVAYDDMSNCEYDNKNPKYCLNIRELNQAINIKKIIDKNPNAKILVHAGHGHIRKKPDNDWIKMADLFQRLTNIAVFSADQTTLVSRSNPNYNNAYYQYITQNYVFDEPIILLDKNKNSWTMPNQIGNYDAFVITPPITNILKLLAHYKTYKIAAKYIKIDNFLQIYVANEGEKAVPIAQLLIDESTQKDVKFYLPIGDYIFYITDNKGKKETLKFSLK